MRPTIVIIGAGISGLTAAVAFARRGLRPVIYEQAPELGEVGAGLALWGSAIATVHRAELLRLLAARIDPAALHLGARCTGFRHTADAVTARFDDGSEVPADLLVGADGVHSVIRGGLLGDAPLRHRGYTAIRSVTPAGSVPLPAHASETWGRGCRFGLAPTGEERLTWYATWNAAPGSGAGGSREHLLGLFGDWHEPIRRVIEATPEDAIVRTEIYDRWPARTWTRGRVAMIGDAIHPMTPDLGQGACQGIADAVTLAGCVAEAADLRAGLLGYQRQRRRNAAVTTMIARTMAASGQLHGRFSCVTRDAMIKALPLPVLLRQLDLVVGRPPAAQPRRRGR